MPLNFLSCFAVVLREIQRNVDISQTDYSIPSKLEFFLILKSYLEVQPQS